MKCGSKIKYIIIPETSLGGWVLIENILNFIIFWVISFKINTEVNIVSWLCNDTFNLFSLKPNACTLYILLKCHCQFAVFRVHYKKHSAQSVVYSWERDSLIQKIRKKGATRSTIKPPPSKPWCYVYDFNLQ